jgi:hypothetical protein
MEGDKATRVLVWLLFVYHEAELGLKLFFGRVEVRFWPELCTALTMMPIF